VGFLLPGLTNPVIDRGTGYILLILKIKNIKICGIYFLWRIEIVKRKYMEKSKGEKWNGGK
jgi:hypothetical protein